MAASRLALSALRGSGAVRGGVAGQRFGLANPRVRCVASASSIAAGARSAPRARQSLPRVHRWLAAAAAAPAPAAAAASSAAAPRASQTAGLHLQFAKQPLPRELQEIEIRIKAYLISTRLDVNALVNEQYSSRLRAVKGNVAVVQLPSVHSLVAEVRALPNYAEDYAPVVDACMADPYGPLNSFAVFFPYGAVVLFGVPDAQHEPLLEVASPYVTAGRQEKPASDDYTVILKMQAADWCSFQPDRVTVREFDLNSIRVISQVLAQTVAMEHYEKQTNHMLETFQALNAKLGAQRALWRSREQLSKILAENNTILNDMIVQLKVLDRSDTAWRYGKYDFLWIGMRNEFELKARFEALEFKVTHVQHNIKFFLEVVQSQRSARLEWIIVFLIATEVAIALFGK